jgi:hypothetical protein
MDRFDFQLGTILGAGCSSSQWVVAPRKLQLLKRLQLSQLLVYVQFPLQQYFQPKSTMTCDRAISYTTTTGIEGWELISLRL